jgi:hemin uptake protein HemP
MSTRPETPPSSQPATLQATTQDTRPGTIDSHDLLQGQSTLLIRHQGEIYRLQVTRQGKLILTK